MSGQAQGSHDRTITSFPIPAQTEQIILITTPTWQSTSAIMNRYQKINNTWVEEGERVTVSLGKNGLAWGRGLHANAEAPGKIEGDGKAPAGVFSLGMMFGYAEKSPSLYDYPYKQCTERDYWVDDADSPDYNRWVTIAQAQPNTPREHWKSFERMKRQDHLYEYGIVINHNTTPVIPGQGSAIFFHVWRSERSPTLGCTSMAQKDMIALAKWVDPKKYPLVIQVPERVRFVLR